MGMNAIESEIFDSIQRLDEPVHSRKIAEYTGFDISDCSRAMYRLKKLELIEQVGEEKLGGIGGRLVPTYMATHRAEQDTDSVETEIAELMRAGPTLVTAQEQAQDDEHHELQESHDGGAEMSLESAIELMKKQGAARDEADPLTRAMNRIRVWSPIRDGRARPLGCVHWLRNSSR